MEKITVITIPSKTCISCKKEYPLSFFYARRSYKTGHGNVCKTCLKRKAKRKIDHWQEGKLLCLRCRKYLSPEEFDSIPDAVHRDGKDRRCRTCKKEQYLVRRANNRGDGTIERVLLERYHGAKDRAVAGKLPIDIDRDYLLSIWNNQDGKCALSGVQMTHIIRSGRVPTNVSVDRIVPELGYVRGNIQLVCAAINQFRADSSLEQLYSFCESILKHKRKMEE